MAELTSQERLQPSLLDRLTDLARERPDESREERVITASRLRECVTRDIGWLLNCTRHWSSEQLAEHPHVDTSVLNFGIPDLTGTALASVEASVLENRIRAALINFEPRLVASTVQVSVNLDESRMDSRSLSFRIEAQMWAQPLPLSLYLRTDLDLETGEFHVSPSFG
ncbi:type VI secretion system baseplate subunit TssE [Paraburkholderia jirisanensis]